MKGLIVTGNVRLQNKLSLLLRRQKLKIDIIFDGYSCLKRIKDENFEIIIIGSDIEDIDGFTLCKTIKFNSEKYNYPMIFYIDDNMTQKSKNEILKLGANDCMHIDFDKKEFAYKLKNYLDLRKNLIKKSPNFQNMGMNLGKSTGLKYANLTLNPKKVQIVEKDGKPEKLPSKEYELLKYFILNKGKILSRKNIRRKVWKTEKEYKEDRRVDICVCRLKKRFKILNSTLMSIRGIGYSLKEIMNV